MKTTWRDSATILMAFAAVFLCGYGIGHLVGERREPSPAEQGGGSDPAWQQQTLEALARTLELRPDQRLEVEQELKRTAAEIAASRNEVILDYHRHLDELYQRLIEKLDPPQADRLRREKKLLEKRIEMLSTG